MDGLLSRDEFRRAVFERDRHRCVVCGAPAQDAHHILERRLWPDGGYYLDNGASVCGADHLRAESTELSCMELRNRIGIEHVVLPPHLYMRNYDKWGNPILDDGRRLRGELFEEPSVQRIMQPVPGAFLPHREQPRGLALEVGAGWVRRPAGAVLRFYADGMYGRLAPLVDPPPAMRALGTRLMPNIPEGFCVEGSWVGMTFHVNFIWNDRLCLSVAETKEWAALLGLEWDEFQDTPGTWSRAPEGFSYREFRDKVNLDVCSY